MTVLIYYLSIVTFFLGGGVGEGALLGNVR